MNSSANLISPTVKGVQISTICWPVFLAFMLFTSRRNLAVVRSSFFHVLYFLSWITDVSRTTSCRAAFGVAIKTIVSRSLETCAATFFVRIFKASLPLELVVQHESELAMRSPCLGAMWFFLHFYILNLFYKDYLRAQKNSRITMRKQATYTWLSVRRKLTSSSLGLRHLSDRIIQYNLVIHSSIY